MAGNDERFENYLREFIPRAPRMLREESGRVARWRRLAAAAALLLAVGTSVWLVLRRSPQRAVDVAIEKTSAVESRSAAARISLGQLNQIAFTQPARLDAQLAEDSRAVLPDFRGEGSTLRALAKE